MGGKFKEDRCWPIIFVNPRGVDVLSSDVAAWIRPAAAEFIGTFMLVVVPALLTSSDNSGVFAFDVALLQSLALGLAYIAPAVAFGHISGAHFNPAITLALLVTENVELGKAMFYIIAQAAGSVVAAVAVMAVEGGVGGGLGGCKVPSTVLTLTSEAGIVEIVAAGFVAIVFMAVAVQERRPQDWLRGSLGPVAVGAATSGAAMCVVLKSGASINPVRCFGPALLAGEWKDRLWLHFTAPVVGAVIFGAIYHFFLLERTPRGLRRPAPKQFRENPEAESSSEYTYTTEYSYYSEETSLKKMRRKFDAVTGHGRDEKKPPPSLAASQSNASKMVASQQARAPESSQQGAGA